MQGSPKSFCNYPCVNNSFNSFGIVSRLSFGDISTFVPARRSPIRLFFENNVYNTSKGNSGIVIFLIIVLILEAG